MKLQLTNRGFMLAHFTDLFGADCSIQESSVIIDGNAIWFGRHQDRVHLTRELVRELLPFLTCFVETGLLCSRQHPDVCVETSPSPNEVDIWAIDPRELSRKELEQAFIRALTTLESFRNIEAGLKDPYANLHEQERKQKTATGGPT